MQDIKAVERNDVFQSKEKSLFLKIPLNDKTQKHAFKEEPVVVVAHCGLDFLYRI